MKQNALYKYRFFIVGGIVLLGVGVAYYLLKNKGKKTSGVLGTNEEIKEGNTLEKKSGLVFSKPVTELKKYPLIYIFGGISYATPDWMLKQTPAYLLSRAVIVFAPYTSVFSAVKKSTENYLTANNLQVDNDKISIAGFSAGGINVQGAYNNSFKAVGLIDPSTRAEYLKLPFNQNTILVYNDSNWTGYPNIKATLPQLDKVIAEKKGTSEKVTLKHSEIPKYFFDKYKEKFL